MGQYPPAQRSCGRCDQPAVYRVALIAPGESPAVMLARRAHYRCAEHMNAALSPASLELSTLRHGALYYVVDAAYTASVLAVTS